LTENLGVGPKKAKLRRDFEVCIQFCSRSAGNTEKLGQLSRRIPTRTFRDIRRDGNRTAPDLGCQAEYFISWKARSLLIDELHQPDRFLPGDQLAMIYQGFHGRACR